LTFNQTLDPEAIAAQQQADPTAARSEWLGEFRDDLSGFLDDELIDSAVDRRSGESRVVDTIQPEEEK
jgi:hypothetical protein